MSVPAVNRARIVNATAARLADDFVAQIESLLPGLLARVHLTGSALSDDWQATCSDVDLVFITVRPLSTTDAAVLTPLHAGTRGGACVDGLYLTEDQLESGPDGISVAPQSVEGTFEVAANGGQLTWITWLEVEKGAERTVRGAGNERWVHSQRSFGRQSRRVHSDGCRCGRVVAAPVRAFVNRTGIGPMTFAVPRIGPDTPGMRARVAGPQDSP